MKRRGNLNRSSMKMMLIQFINRIRVLLKTGILFQEIGSSVGSTESQSKCYNVAEVLVLSKYIGNMKNNSKLIKCC